MHPHDTMAFLLKCLPQTLSAELCRMDAESLCEIRLRCDRAVQFNMGNALVTGSYTPAQADIDQITEALSEHALYARYDEARRGYVTLRGGHRMGLCGRVMQEKDEVMALCEIASLSLRIAREVHGAAAGLLKCIKRFPRLPSVLILGAPATGKTTLLRDLIRVISNNGVTVGVNDERGEIAACQAGVPQLDVGLSTDVLDGCQKAYGIRWLLRSMSPMAVATDEIGSMADAMALMDAMASGIAILATVHAGTLQDLDARSDLSVMRHQKAFDLYVLLKSGETGVIDCVYDKEGSPCPF